eukprot:GGOE01036312.1.p2 GENE.GGOE01036312.1~~GGOE01036312.1.p2  ORF type:complete len:172 (-),score=50.37 GGOE01036312.1:114-572(-)
MSDEFRKQNVPGGVLYRHPTLEQAMASMQARYGEATPQAGRPLTAQEIADIRLVRHSAATMRTSNAELAKKFNTSELFVQMAASDAREQHLEEMRHRRAAKRGAPPPTTLAQYQSTPQVKPEILPSKVGNVKLRRGEKPVDKTAGGWPLKQG